MDPSSNGQPAGFFSTFSILDLNSSTRENPVRAQKRNRRVFVCIPCHQRKLKCDKGRPCSRCVRSGTADECFYQPLPASKQRQESTSSATEPEDSVRLESSPGSSCSDGRIRLNGITHWRSIAGEFEEAWPYITGSDSEWAPRYRQLRDLGCLFSSLPGISFPLGDGCQYSRTRDQVLATLPPRQLVEALLRCYFRAFESTHRLMHPQQFYLELLEFWVDDARLPDIWISQLCMMLALGCRAAPDHLFSGSGRSRIDCADLLLDAAQFFYGGSPISITPSITTVRTLCLAVMARMMEIVKGTTEAQLVSLMGITTRLAMTMHLHRTTSLFPEISAFEAEMRKRVWVTVQLLDLDIAMRTGTSYVCRDHDADTPLNLDDDDISHSEHGWMLEEVRCAPLDVFTDSTYQIKLSELLPLLAEVINTLNSPNQQGVFEQSKMQPWVRQLRHKLEEAEHELCMGSHVRPEIETMDRVSTQVQFLRVLVHRTLMALQHDYACTPRGGWTRSPDATRQVIQSSISLLRTQQAWHLSSPTTAPAVTTITHHSRSPSPLAQSSPQLPIITTNWLVDLCHDDFGAAMFYLMLALRGRDFDRVRDQGSIPSRSETWAILRQSLEIFGKRARQSLFHFKEFVGLSVAASCLQSLDLGQPILPRLQQVAVNIERRILFDSEGGGGGRQDDDASLLWAGPNVVESNNHQHTHHHHQQQQQHLAAAAAAGVVPQQQVDFHVDLFEFGYE
ncbi:hypothetical protein B0H66DRAFT_526693 [Apodospora peruviana]|uniref:Zn(2)-C6 fungal-type domain-containing protein n=1 Tax=Apodospora peruviana TaxID=516989 RepID=A0AAE0IQW8_9PEZI|nr:hypothetical protein B0H66DRAFT_526693 [Apodospora peruviana]